MLKLNDNELVYAFPFRNLEKIRKTTYDTFLEQRT